MHVPRTELIGSRWKNHGKQKQYEKVREGTCWTPTSAPDSYETNQVCEHQTKLTCNEMKAAEKTRVSPLHDLAIRIPIVDLLGLSASHLICQNQAKQVVNCATVRSSSGEIKFLPLAAQKSSACIGQTYHIIRLVTLLMKSMEWNSYEQVTCSRLPEREWRVASLCRCRCLRSEESHPWSTGWFSFVSCVAKVKHECCSSIVLCIP